MPSSTICLKYLEIPGPWNEFRNIYIIKLIPMHAISLEIQSPWNS